MIISIDTGGRGDAEHSLWHSSAPIRVDRVGLLAVSALPSCQDEPEEPQRKRGVLNPPQNTGIDRAAYVCSRCSTKQKKDGRDELHFG